jgi:hypothetical protein
MRFSFFADRDAKKLVAMTIDFIQGG